MARITRPSDIYRLPEQAGSGQSPVAPPQPTPPRGRRIPAGVWVGVVLAGALVVSGLAGGAGEPVPGDVPLVDIISEDQAIAALALYGAQVETIDALQEQEQIYEGSGPPAAAGAAARGGAAVQRALDGARTVPNPDPLLTAYVAHAGHAETQQALSEAATTAEMITLLAATHDSMYSGSGAIGLDEAYDKIAARISAGSVPGPLQRWGSALLGQLENRPTIEEAYQARAEVGVHWQILVSDLEPAAVAELQAYLRGLPPVTVDGLRGHPVAGPALEHLEDTIRTAPHISTTPLPST